MKVKRAGAGVVAAVGAGLWLLAAAPEVRAQVKLEYKYPEGKNLRYKTTIKSTQVLTIGGMEITTEGDEEVVLLQTAGKRAGDGSLPVKMKIESHRSQLTLPGGAEVKYDSTDPNAKIDNPQLAFLEDLYKLASQVEYTVVLDGKDKVKAVEGTEKLVEKADKLDPLVRGVMRKQLHADTLKARFEQSHGNLPDVLARPGEPWERSETLGSGGQEFLLRKKYEYAGTEKKGDRTLDKITSKVVEAKMQIEPNDDAPFQVVKADLKVESSDGTILFDRESGQIIEGKGSLHVKGPATFRLMGQDVAGEMDVTFESSSGLLPETKTGK